MVRLERELQAIEAVIIAHGKSREQYISVRGISLARKSLMTLLMMLLHNGTQPLDIVIREEIIACSIVICKS